MDKLISIIIPAYNAGKSLEESIKSLTSQTYTNIEIIVVDDGSKDDTYQVATSLAEKDSRIKVIRIANNGVSNARNTGIAYSSGYYLAFMDADDHMESTMIDKLQSLMNKDMDMICCGYKVVSEDNSVLFEQKPQAVCIEKSSIYQAVEMLQECNCMNSLWNKLFRSSIIKENNLNMDVSLSMGEDLLFILDYMKHMSGKITIFPDTEYRYTLSPNGLQANFTNGIKIRLHLLDKIREFYCSQNCPMDGFYLEEIRTLYIMCLENSKSLEQIKTLLKLPICEEVCNQQFRCSGKFRCFKMLLKCKNAVLLLMGMNVFRSLKKIQGKSYEWQK